MAVRGGLSPFSGLKFVKLLIQLVREILHLSGKCQKSLAVATIYLSSPGISLWSCHHHFFSNSDCFILFDFLVFCYFSFRFSCWAVQKCFTRGWCGRNFKLVKWPFIFTMSFSPGNQSHNHSYFNFRFFPWGLQHIRKKAFTGTKFWIVSSKCNWNWSQSSCSVLRCCKNWHFIFYHQICMDTHFKDCFQLDSSCQLLSPWQRFM